MIDDTVGPRLNRVISFKRAYLLKGDRQFGAFNLGEIQFNCIKLCPLRMRLFSEVFVELLTGWELHSLGFGVNLSLR